MKKLIREQLGMYRIGVLFGIDLYAHTNNKELGKEIKEFYKHMIGFKKWSK